MTDAAPRSVAVLGPGGVGGLVAGALARAGRADVVVVASEPTAEAIARDGLRVRSVALGDFAVPVRAVAHLAEPVEVLVVATKATGLDAALERVAQEPGLVVPLLNGVEHVARLRERFGPRAVAATIRVESVREAPGEVRQTSRFLRVELASDDAAVRSRLGPVADLLGDAGIPAAVGPSEADVMWSKLSRLAALASTTAAHGVPLGEIRDDPARRAELEACVAETVAVARAEGADVQADAVLAEIGAAHPELVSSLARDVAAGREGELDAIAGAVVRAGARHGLECPTLARLADDVRGRLAAA